jgi:hypothetical protein
MAMLTNSIVVDLFIAQPHISGNLPLPRARLSATRQTTCCIHATALDIGTRFAYKSCSTLREGRIQRRQESMATKKNLKKGKKIASKKSLRRLLNYN